MGAKSFKGGMDTLLGEIDKKDTTSTTTGSRGRPKTNFKTITKTSQVGTKENETRATFIVSEEQLESLKALAHWERVLIKDILSQAINSYLETKKRELPKAVDSYKSRSKIS